MSCCRDGHGHSQSNSHSHGSQRSEGHDPVRPSVMGRGGGGGEIRTGLRRAPATGDVVDRRGGKCGPGGGGCGCHRDLGPLEDHEGPSEADLERFSNPTRACPECKTEVYDDTAVCWSCGHAFGGSGESKPMPTWAMAAAVIVGLALVGVMVL